jgi:hypothetical protein
MVNNLYTATNVAGQIHVWQKKRLAITSALSLDPSRARPPYKLVLNCRVISRHDRLLSAVGAAKAGQSAPRLGHPGPRIVTNTPHSLVKFTLPAAMLENLAEAFD